jgi:PPK2 family polyphosphate:nucleotide phosphotransferase
MKSLQEISNEPPKQASKKECKKALKVFHEQLFELQNVFYADARFSLLIILQGMDTSGKDGVIRHVMTCINPMGLHVKSFKKPSEEEQNHDFLWRIYPHIPAKSMIEVFNRSYYEDILVPSVNNTLPNKRLQHRFKLINELEQHFIQDDIHVLKFFLHISKDKQQEKIKNRLIKPHKRWKYSIQDEKAAKNWDAYAKVYNQLIKRCNQVPWHIIPANKRWYRNYSVAKILTEHFQQLNLKYPSLKKE